MKENNLKLVTTETFGDLSCEFYCDNNNEILLTREQIGTALGYKYPDDAMCKIHKHHKERLDEFSVLAKLASTDGKSYETTLYTQRGVMEICRWSNKPKANQFMDWVWDIVEKYRNNELNNLSYDMSSVIQSINNLTETMNTAITSLDERLRNLEENAAKPQKAIQNKKYKSRWLKDTFRKLGLFLDYLKENKDTLSDTLLPQSGKLDLPWTIHLVIKQAEDTNPAFDFDEYRERFEYETQTNDYLILTYIEYYPATKKLFTETLDLILTSLGLDENRINNKSMLDELLSCIS